MDHGRSALVGSRARLLVVLPDRTDHVRLCAGQGRRVERHPARRVTGKSGSFLHILRCSGMLLWVLAGLAVLALLDHVLLRVESRG